MAVQKKHTSMLQQGAMEAQKAEREAARLRMKEQMQSGVGQTPTTPAPTAKKKSKAQQIKERRPMQVSIHFTQEEKYALEDAKTTAKRLGIPDATVEDFIHGLVVAGLRDIKSNNELLKAIISENANIAIS